MRKSKEIIGTNASNFARIISRKLNRQIVDEVDGDLVEAEINHGRWIVRCPYCTGAEIADREDPVFLCLSCFNETNGGKFRPVRFPADALKIENTLGKRKKEENQNWVPGETVVDLENETREKGGAE